MNAIKKIERTGTENDGKRRTMTRGRKNLLKLIAEADEKTLDRMLAALTCFE